MFDTENEKKRNQYKELYDDLKDCHEDFKKKLREIEENVKAYESSRPTMDGSVIPEDVFSVVEPKFLRKINGLMEEQKDYFNKLAEAVDDALQRYRHYSNLVEEDNIRAEEERRNIEIRMSYERKKRGNYR